jgi:hypothetical protein
MFSVIRRHISYANVVATLALVFAMSGGALAAKHYLVNSTKQINPKVLKKLTGQSGRNGATGATGPSGLAGSPGKEGPAGREGAQGPGAREITVSLPASATPSFTPVGGAFGINLEAKCEEKVSHAVVLKMNYTSTSTLEDLQTGFESIGGGPTKVQNTQYTASATATPAFWDELEATEKTSIERFEGNFTSPRMIATESYLAKAGPSGKCEAAIGWTPAS